jgi:hypothetical protein
MTTYQASVPTEHASRYLQQLCKHWSHRFPVEFDPAQGLVHLNGATCRFQANPLRLVLTLQGEETQALPRLCTVVAEHLQRFAFREQLAIEWTEAAAG